MEDFESSPDYQALVVAAAGKPEKRMGESVIPAEPPQWKNVHAMAMAMLEKWPLQLPIHIYLIQAEAHISGFLGLQQRLQTLLTVLENQWDDVQPEPDADDPEDPWYARVNLVKELAEQPGFLETVHRLPLVAVRGIGEFSARDMDIAAGTISASDEEKARCQAGLIHGAFAESATDELQQRHETLMSLSSLCRMLETVFAERCGETDILSMQRLISLFDDCQKHFNAQAAPFLDTVDAASVATDDTLDSTHDVAPTVASALSPVDIPPAAESSLQSREHMLQALHAILLYYQQHEPSSPVRVLINGVQAMVNLSFFEVLQFLSPTSGDDLPRLLRELQQEPLGALLRERFSRHVAGESIALLQSDSALSGEAENRGEGGVSGTDYSEKGNSHTIPVVRSRAQVVALLQDIETWFYQNEPASPVPLILVDIRRLVPGRFSELIAELARLLPDTATGES